MFQSKSQSPVENEQGVLDLVVVSEAQIAPRPGIVLPEFREDGACLKCGSKMFTTQYHRGVLSSEPCFALWYHQENRDETVFPEHFDRGCVRCGYRWCEGIL
jgi:hypothetical protein